MAELFNSLRSSESSRSCPWVGEESYRGTRLQELGFSGSSGLPGQQQHCWGGARVVMSSRLGRSRSTAARKARSSLGCTNSTSGSIQGSGYCLFLGTALRLEHGIWCWPLGQEGWSRSASPGKWQAASEESWGTRDCSALRRDSFKDLTSLRRDTGAQFAQTVCATSDLGDFKNVAGQSPEQPGLISCLILLWEGGWTKDLPRSFLI